MLHSMRPQMGARQWVHARHHAQPAHRIHQRHLVQVHPCPGAVALELCLQGLQMRRLQVADQPEHRVVPVNLPFNLAGPWRYLLPLLCAVDDR
jgi:hypothetical protein